MTVGDGIDAEVGDLVAVVVGLGDGGGMTRTAPVLGLGNRLVLDRGKLVQPPGALGEPVAGLELDDGTPCRRDLGHGGLIALAVLALLSEAGDHVGPLLGLLDGGSGEQLDGLGVVSELGHHGGLVQGQVVASCHLGGDLAAGHDEGLANLSGLYPGHGGDVLLGHAVESRQLLDGHGLLDRGEVVPSHVLHQHAGHPVDRRQVIAHVDRDGGKASGNGRVLPALTGDQHQLPGVGGPHQRWGEDAQGGDRGGESLPARSGRRALSGLSRTVLGSTWRSSQPSGPGGCVASSGL